MADAATGATTTGADGKGGSSATATTTDQRGVTAGTGAGAAGAGADKAGAADKSKAADGAGAGAGDGAGVGAGSGAGAAWDANWRETYAKDDAAKLNVLKRFASPGAALDALFSAQQKIRSGDLKAALPKDATPEQRAAYRAENEIPEKPEGYLDKLPEGLKVVDDDKPIIEPYLKVFHDENVSPALAHKLLTVRNAEHERMIEARVTADESLKTATEDKLRGEWGNDYRANINSIHGMLDGAPPEVSEAILQARTPDGNPLVGTPEVVRWLAQLSRELNPFGTIVPATGGTLDGKGVEDRIAQIEGLMGDRNSTYWKGPMADKTQKEYRDLIDARNNMRKRNAA
jgi:hypothetical protein